MERPFNTGDFFGEPAFADVTIKFSNREIRAHKIILCTKSKYFERALKEGRFKEGQEGVLELHDDNPTAVYDMLHYIYTSNYCAPASRLPEGFRRYRSRWGRHPELAIIADKYGITSLKDTALKLLDNADQHLHSESDVIKFVARAQDCPIEEKRLDKIINKACSGRFASCFRYPSFRTWLADRPHIRDELCSRNIEALMRPQAFHDMLKNDGGLALKVLEGFMERHNTHLQKCSSGCPRQTGKKVAPKQQQLEPDAEEGDHEHQRQIDEAYEDEESDSSSVYEGGISPLKVVGVHTMR